MALTLLTAGCATQYEGHLLEIGGRGSDVAIKDLRSAVSNGLLKAQITFENNGDDPITGFYRCQFQDPNGMSVGTTQIWQPVTIYPNGIQQATCMATEAEATDFKVEFSEDGSHVSVMSD